MESKFDLTKQHSIEQPVAVHNVNNSMIFERHVEEQVHILNSNTPLVNRSSSILNLANSEENEDALLFAETNFLRSRQNSSISTNRRKYSNGNLSLLKIPSNYSTSSVAVSMTNSTSTNNISSTPHHHRHLENFVPPMLDAGCSIVNDENTNLNDIDMLIPERPSSTLGLDLALGRTNSQSSSSIFQGMHVNSMEQAFSDRNTLKNNNNNANNVYSTKNPLLRSYSYSSSNADGRPSVTSLQSGSETSESSISTSNLHNNLKSPLGSPETGKVLRCYSYADVLLDEIADNTNKSLQSHPSQVQLQRNLSTPFIIRRDSNTSLNKRIPPSLARSPTNSTNPSSSFINANQLRSPRSNITNSNINTSNPLINANNLRKVDLKFQIGEEDDISDYEEDVNF